MPSNRKKPNPYLHTEDLFGDGPEWVSSWDKWRIARDAERVKLTAEGTRKVTMPLDIVGPDIQAVPIEIERRDASTLDT